MTMNRRLFLASIALTLLITGCGQRDTRQTQVMISSDGYAIKGYDPVAYFASNKAMKGSPEISVAHNDAVWLFSNEQNRDQFTADPEKYTPQYGGWCAYGMAEGYAAETDPENAWAIHDDKLYLNWDEEVAKDWKADQANLLQRSEEKWPGVSTQLDNNEATIYWHD